MGGDRHGHRAQLGVLHEPEGHIHQAAISGCHEHAAADLAFGVGVIGGKRKEVEGRVIGRKWHVTLELEAHHLARVGAQDRQHNGLDRHDGARKPDGDTAWRHLPRIQLSPERRRRLLGLDDEGLDVTAADDAGAQPIADEHHGKPGAIDHHLLEVSTRITVVLTIQ